MGFHNGFGNNGLMGMDNGLELIGNGYGLPMAMKKKKQ